MYDDHYPSDGRGASDYPGIWTDMLSHLPNWVPWENFVPSLNGGFDRWVSRHVISNGLLSAPLQFLFGKRGSEAEESRSP